MTHKTTIFLASSKELEAERKEFEQFIGRRNKQWLPEGIFLHLDVWEDFDDSMSATGKQDDYNAAILVSDIFVLLAHTKVGKYTREEFETAWKQFRRTARPKILTYIKSPVEPGEPDPGPEYDTVRELQKRLAELAHWPNKFDGPAELLLHFGAQLDTLRKSGFIKADKSGAAAAPPYIATVNGPGAIAQGNNAQAGGAGAVIIGGGNSGPINAGRQTNIHIVGGAHVAGNVKVKGGDFVGRDKTVRGLGAQDLAALFETLRQQVLAQAPSPEDAQLAQVNLDALAAEVAKPEGKRSDGLMARLLEGVVGLVPGAVSAVASAFGTPLIAGIAGPATAAVLQRLGMR